MNEETVTNPAATLVVTQDNAARGCIIVEATEAAAAHFGESAASIVGSDFLARLAPKTRDFIHDMLEYEADAPDLDEVLSKLRETIIITTDGQENTIDMQLSPILSRDGNPWFQVQFPDAREARANAQFMDSLRASLESRLVLDEATGLPDSATCHHFFKSAHSFVNTREIPAAFAALRMDRFEKSIALYGKEGCNQLTQHLANSCGRMLSDDDVVCVLNEKIVALFLFNFSRESARVMLNRMRWNLRSHRIDFGGKADFSVTASIAFDMISDPDGEGALARCEEVLMALDQDERNQLIEPNA